MRIESDRVGADRAAAAEALRRAQQAIEETRIARLARESELASARIEHEWRARLVRSGEHELAGMDARLKSLEELEAARAGYGDAARTLLAQANGKVEQKGAVADYLEVETGYERAVEACLADLLQHVIVERPEHAAAGFGLVRESGRGPLRVPDCRPRQAQTSGSGRTDSHAPWRRSDGVVAPVVCCSRQRRLRRRHSGRDRRCVDRRLVRPRGRGQPPARRCAVVTPEGDVFRGPHLVTGGSTKKHEGFSKRRARSRTCAAAFRPNARRSFALR